MVDTSDYLGMVEDQLDKDEFEVFLRAMIKSLPDPFKVTEARLSLLMSAYCRNWLTTHRTG